jgi:cytochrome c oxidase cbb3-type subunit 3
MFRAHRLYLIVGLLLIAACSPGSEESAPAAAPEGVRAESWREGRMLTGRETYETVCASCHDQGEGDAPAIGDREAWSGRSDLWPAVLSGHATAGYLDMPEKGGHGELTDEQVTAATEYMLLETFPEKPRD